MARFVVIVEAKGTHTKRAYGPFRDSLGRLRAPAGARGRADALGWRSLPRRR